MESIHRWQHQYIGSTTLPKDMGVLELQRFFTFSEGELAALSRRKDEYRVAAAIQLGFLRMSGSPLSDLQSLPLRLVRYVAAQLGLQHSVTVTSLRHLYKRSKTRYEQQWWAMTFLGFSKPEKDAMDKLDAYLQVEAAEAPSVDALLLSARIWLYQHNYIGVPLAELRALANRAVVASEAAILNHIHRQASPSVIGRWLSRLMATRPETGRTTLEWLQQPPRRKSINAIRYRTERVEFLKEMGVDKLDLEPIPIRRNEATQRSLIRIHDRFCARVCVRALTIANWIGWAAGDRGKPWPG